MNETKTNESEKKGIKAKSASLYAQIIGAVWIGGWNAAQNVRDLIAGQPLNVNGIITSGIAIAACFVPVYFNLFMDKIKDIKLGA